MTVNIPKGTKDILPADYDNGWDFIINSAESVLKNAGFKKISTPIFEVTELFSRGVGDSTDIVNKEMYTFIKSDRSYTLRPENTAGVVRAFCEHGMHRELLPLKLWYFGPMFRYERPQAGRQRQFHQIGTEVFGSSDPSVDADCIGVAVSLLHKIGIKNLSVQINSLGCNDCRSKMRSLIKSVIEQFLPELCPDCQRRFETNPLRILDCKVPECRALFDKHNLTEKIGSINLCPECSDHFYNVQTYLNDLGIKYSVNPFLVRGLDYYTRTVFEIVSDSSGSQNAVCGGGRYDNLVETLGGVSMPAFGWAFGTERIYSLIEKRLPQKIKYFVISDNISEALKLASQIRNAGVTCETDYSKRKFSKQFERASKIAEYAVILGSDEINSDCVSVKNLTNSEQIKLSRNEFISSL